MANYPTCLQNIIKAYAYTQYNDDDDILAFFIAFNTMAQAELDFLNNLNLPVYTGAIIAGLLLDWVGQGLYGIPRPVIALGTVRFTGPLDTWPVNTKPINAIVSTGQQPYVQATDDIYKRVLTWHHYRGDGKQFTIPWLKRRIARFLFAPNGTDLNNLSLNAVSVTVSGTTFTIKVPSADPNLYALFGALVRARQLEMPFQYAFTVS